LFPFRWYKLYHDVKEKKTFDDDAKKYISKKEEKQTLALNKLQKLKNIKNQLRQWIFLGKGITKLPETTGEIGNYLKTSSWKTISHVNKCNELPEQ